jgi:hypothetical protein
VGPRPPRGRAPLLGRAGLAYLPGLFEDGEAAARTTFGSAYDRLVDLKDEYDPPNPFG